MRFKIFFAIFVVFLGLSLISCTGTQEQAEPEEKPAMDMVQVRQSIEEGNAKLGEAVRMGDAAVLAALYAEDARILPPNSEIIQGKQGIQEFWAGAFQMGVKDAVLTTLDVIPMGDMVCEIGKVEITIGPQEEGMEPLQDVGKYVVIWKKSDVGVWQLYIDIWNTNTPLM
jgi:ketosteroid isomerase-like protein